MSSWYAFSMLSLMTSLSASPSMGPSSLSFSSEQEAAKAAADIYNPMSIHEDREYMGTIYKGECGYRFTVAAGRKGRDQISIKIPATEWDNVVAFWHTHGDASPQHRYFSDVDTKMVNRFGKTFYLADYTGFLKLFEPGGKTISPYAAGRLGLPSEKGYAIGEVVRDEFRRSVRVKTSADRSHS